MSESSASFGWGLRRAFSGIGKHKFQTFLAFLLASLAMTLGLLSASIAWNLQAPVQSVSLSQEMTVFTRSNVNAARAEELKEFLAGQDGIESVRVVTPDEAMAQVRKGNADADDENPLPFILLAAIRTDAADETLQETADLLKKQTGVDSVAYDKNWNRNLAVIGTALHRFSFLIGGLLSGLILSVLLGCAGLSATTEPKEAERLSLLGASRTFISRPDAFRGAFVFAAAAVAAILASGFAFAEIAPAFSAALGLYKIKAVFTPLTVEVRLGFFTAALFAGAFLSGIFSLLRLRKHVI